MAPSTLNRIALLAALFVGAATAVPWAAQAWMRHDATEGNTTTQQDCTHFLPYSSDADHIWNRVHRRLLERRDRHGHLWGCDEVDPLLWQNTIHLLRGNAYKETVRLLDEFTSTHAERLIRESLPRAIFQHDLWAVFDWLAGPLNGHEEERAQL